MRARRHDVIVKIRGTGCANCKTLEMLAHEAAAEAGLEPAFEKVTELPAIMTYGVVSTPGLVVDERVVSSGRIPSKQEVVGWLRTASSSAV
ncbi:MAG: TM0996/MTH895 family glutaredoxin-like protein [Chloroflexi bacterium]|nr:TM0996/MTH895 family glutaredoxin-like protein [Chloroflexota bacterium]